MANIPLQYPFPYKTTNNTGFTSSVEFNTVTVLGDVTIDQNLTVAGNITTTDLTVGDDLTVGGTIDAQALRAFGIWDSPTATVTGAGAWIGFDGNGHTIFANRKSAAGQTNSWRWYAFDHTNAFQGELMRLSNAGNLFISGTRIEFPLVHFQQPPGTFPQYDFILPSAMGGAGQVLTSAGAGSPTYWTTPSGGGGGGGTVTNVTGTSPISVTSPTTTPNISLGTVPTTLGGTGLTTVGTNGQVLSSNGTTLQYVTLPTPVTSVSATSPLASTGGTAPDIYIASATGSGAVVLNNAPTFDTQFYLDSPGTNDGYLRFVSVGGANYIQSSLQPTAGSAADLYFTSFNAASTWMTIKDTGDVGIGTTAPGCKVDVLTALGNTTMRLKGTPESLILDGTDHVFMRYAWAGVNKAYVGFGNAGDPNFDISNVATGGHINLFPNANVGIGTTSPTQKLHVVDSGTADTVSIQNTNASGYASISFDTTTQDFTLGVGGPTATAFSGALQNKIYFYYNTDVRVVIDTSGNFGIGTTSPSTKLQVNGTTRSTNFTTNGTNTFTYASGTFTPRIAMFYTSDGKVYECNNAPAGKDNMGITYSVQTGVWVRVGNLVTVNMEIQYSQTYSGITFDLTNLNIVAVIPEAACNPSTLGAVGMTGYPSRIADRFVDNFQMNYWISNTAYAPGGSICEVQLRRNNTHDMMPWDPTSKGGQRVNITTSYYVSQ